MKERNFFNFDNEIINPEQNQGIGGGNDGLKDFYKKREGQESPILNKVVKGIAELKNNFGSAYKKIADGLKSVYGFSSEKLDELRNNIHEMGTSLFDRETEKSGTFFGRFGKSKVVRGCAGLIAALTISGSLDAGSKLDSGVREASAASETTAQSGGQIEQIQQSVESKVEVDRGQEFSNSYEVKSGDSWQSFLIKFFQENGFSNPMGKANNFIKANDLEFSRDGKIFPGDKIQISGDHKIYKLTRANKNTTSEVQSSHVASPEEHYNRFTEQSKSYLGEPNYKVTSSNLPPYSVGDSWNKATKDAGSLAEQQFREVFKENREGEAIINVENKNTLGYILTKIFKGTDVTQNQIWEKISRIREKDSSIDDIFPGDGVKVKWNGNGDWELVEIVRTSKSLELLKLKNNSEPKNEVVPTIQPQAKKVEKSVQSESAGGKVEVKPQQQIEPDGIIGMGLEKHNPDLLIGVNIVDREKRLVELGNSGFSVIGLADMFRENFNFFKNIKGFAYDDRFKQSSDSILVWSIVNANKLLDEFKQMRPNLGVDFRDSPVKVKFVLKIKKDGTPEIFGGTTDF